MFAAQLDVMGFFLSYYCKSNPLVRKLEFVCARKEGSMGVALILEVYISEKSPSTVGLTSPNFYSP